MSRVFEFLNVRERKRPRFVLLAFVAFLLAACEQAQLTASPPPTQPPPPATPPPPSTGGPQEAIPTAPDVAEPAGTIVDILRQPDQITVGILLPLTGGEATLGRDLLAAAEMAVFDLADSNFELRVYDTGGNAERARAAAAAARQDGVQVIVGPLFSNAVLAAAEVARPANIPVLAFSNNQEIAGEGVYALGFVPEAQVRRIVDYAYRQGITRFSVLAPDDLYGSRMVAALNDAVFGGGREITDVAFYQDETQILIDTVKQLGRYDERHQALLAQRRELAARNDEISRRALKRLEDLETLGDPAFEALLLPAGGEEVLRIAPLLAFYDIDPSQIRLLGTWLWDDASLSSEPSMIGAWFAAPPKTTRQRFVERFEQLQDRLPDRRATLAYDATALTIVLAQRAARENETGANTFTTAALTSSGGFAGMDGVFRLLPSGLAERGLAIFEIQTDGAREIDPAPTGFGDFTN